MRNIVKHMYSSNQRRGLTINNGTPVVKLNLTLILSVILTLLIHVVFFELNQQLGIRQSLYMVRWLGPGGSGAVRCGPVRLIVRPLCAARRWRRLAERAKH